MTRAESLRQVFGNGVRGGGGAGELGPIPPVHFAALSFSSARENRVLSEYPRNYNGFNNIF